MDKKMKEALTPLIEVIKNVDTNDIVNALEEMWDKYSKNNYNLESDDCNTNESRLPNKLIYIYDKDDEFKGTFEFVDNASLYDRVEMGDNVKMFNEHYGWMTFDVIGKTCNDKSVTLITKYIYDTLNKFTGKDYDNSNIRNFLNNYIYIGFILKNHIMKKETTSTIYNYGDKLIIDEDKCDTINTSDYCWALSANEYISLKLSGGACVDKCQYGHTDILSYALRDVCIRKDGKVGPAIAGPLHLRTSKDEYNIVFGMIIK